MYYLLIDLTEGVSLLLCPIRGWQSTVCGSFPTQPVQVYEEQTHVVLPSFLQELQEWGARPYYVCTVLC